MAKGRSCRPPKPINVRGHWRQVRKKRKRKAAARAAPKGGYWTVTDGKHRCGHHHRTLAGAAACANRHRRSERAHRARYKGSMRKTWTAARVK